MGIGVDSGHGATYVLRRFVLPEFGVVAVHATPAVESDRLRLVGNGHDQAAAGASGFGAAFDTYIETMSFAHAG